MKLLLLLILCFVILHRGETITCHTKSKTNAEAKLKYDLLCNDYDKSQRPVGDEKNATLLSFQMALHDFSFDEKLQKLRLNTWVFLSWYDERLKWDTDKYEEIDSISEVGLNIWEPEMTSYNADIHEMKKYYMCSQSTCLIDMNGTVVCVYPCSYVSACDMNYIYWPFDRQNCSLNMGSWLTPSNEINFKAEEEHGFYNFQNQHNQWKMLYSDFIVHKTPIETECCGKQYIPILKFYFILERHASYESALIITPIFVIVALNLIGLWLEPGCMERLTLVLTSLVLHFFLVYQIYEYVPRNGENIPKVVSFLRNSTLMTGILIIETVIVRSIARIQTYLPLLIDFITNLITKSFVGRYFITNNLNEIKKPINEDDEEKKDESETKKDLYNTKENLKWKLFSKLIDRLLFIIYLILYIVFFFTSIQFGYKYIPVVDDY